MTSTMQKYESLEVKTTASQLRYQNPEISLQVAPTFTADVSPCHAQLLP